MRKKLKGAHACTTTGGQCKGLACMQGSWEGRREGGGGCTPLKMGQLVLGGCS